MKKVSRSSIFPDEKSPKVLNISSWKSHKVSNISFNFKWNIVKLKYDKMTWIYHNIKYCYVWSRVRMAMVSMNIMMVSMAVLGAVLYLQVTFVVVDFFLDLFAFPVLSQMWFFSLIFQESGAKSAALGIVPVICVLLYMFEDLDYTQILFLADTNQYFTQYSMKLVKISSL